MTIALNALVQSSIFLWATCTEQMKRPGPHRGQVREFFFSSKNLEETLEFDFF